MGMTVRTALCRGSIWIGIVLTVAIAHVPILLMQGIYWDDWVLRQFVIDGDFAGHFTLWKELGLPGFAYLHWWIGSVGSSPETAHNVLSFLVLIAIPLLVYSIARAMKCRTKESMMMAIVAGVYPALETTFAFNVSVYLLMIALLLSGSLIALKADRLRGTRHIAARISAHILFIISFQHHSLLVFYGGFLLLVLMQTWEAGRPLGNILVQFLRSHADFILLPIVFWCLDTALLPRVGYYNNITFDVHVWRTALLGFISKGLMEQLREILRMIASHPMVWLGTVISAALTGLLGVTKSNVSADHRRIFLLLGYGMLLLILAMLPYILVGKAPRAHGYTTRHGMLLAIPVGILITGIAGLIPSRKQWQIIIRRCALVTAYTGSVLALWTNYALWEARWAKDSSLITYFTDHPELKSIGTFVIEDGMPVTTEHYRYYEWGGMMRKAWGEQGRIGMYADENIESISKIGAFHPHWKEWYHLAGYPLTPCTATLRITKTTDLADLRIGWKYYLLSLSFDDASLKTFVRDLTAIEVQRDPKTCT